MTNSCTLSLIATNGAAIVQGSQSLNEEEGAKKRAADTKSPSPLLDHSYWPLLTCPPFLLFVIELYKLKPKPRRRFCKSAQVKPHQDHKHELCVEEMTMYNDKQPPRRSPQQQRAQSAEDTTAASRVPPLPQHCSMPEKDAVLFIDFLYRVIYTFVYFIIIVITAMGRRIFQETVAPILDKMNSSSSLYPSYDAGESSSHKSPALMPTNSMQDDDPESGISVNVSSSSCHSRGGTSSIRGSDDLNGAQDLKAEMKFDRPNNSFSARRRRSIDYIKKKRVHFPRIERGHPLRRSYPITADKKRQVQKGGDFIRNGIEQKEMQPRRMLQLRSENGSADCIRHGATVKCTYPLLDRYKSDS